MALSSVDKKAVGGYDGRFVPLPSPPQHHLWPTWRVEEGGKRRPRVKLGPAENMNRKEIRQPVAPVGRRISAKTDARAGLPALIRGRFRRGGKDWDLRFGLAEVKRNWRIARHIYHCFHAAPAACDFFHVAALGCYVYEYCYRLHSFYPCLSCRLFFVPLELAHRCLRPHAARKDGHGVNSSIGKLHR